MGEILVNEIRRNTTKAVNQKIHSPIHYGSIIIRLVSHIQSVCGQLLRTSCASSIIIRNCIQVILKAFAQMEIERRLCRYKQIHGIKMRASQICDARNRRLKKSLSFPAALAV